ncbi:polymerase delta-interacting protein 2 [Fasciolopsis buskii]|uniref:Polymerase delta-interacting protein 2 n=1 Tax=Fasciolopsis buskii TaxID=27845 RepID=A0A8E0RSJ4_9TREM|nr:polymerase delta-interacting protein 2 [Fasciolopsis buski]
MLLGRFFRAYFRQSVGRLSMGRLCFFNSQAAQLEPIGRLQPVSEDTYEPGQLFLHKHFGYRGVILQSWPAKLFDRNVLSLKATELKMHEYKKEDGLGITMYQVLTDQRDIDLCNSALKSGITFLPDDKRVFNTIYIVSGMDYVFHEDIIPYSSSDAVPIQNEYSQEFFTSVPEREPSFIPTDNLRRWIEARKQSLEVTSVHRETTDGIRTTTVPFFMGRRLVVGERPEKHIRYWRYLIRLENLSSERVQLRERFWKVFSITGSLESVRGKGVVGMQPILAEDSRVFQYHSHVQVPVPWAHMWGSLRFEKPNGSTLDVKIPSFPLCDRAYWSGNSSEPKEEIE